MSKQLDEDWFSEGEFDDAVDSAYFDGREEGLAESAKEIARLRGLLEEATEALEEISDTPHCIYPPSPDQYQIGVVDGHRCAATTARATLARIRGGKP